MLVLLVCGYQAVSELGTEAGDSAPWAEPREVGKSSVDGANVK
jgi:hypothetical protein